MGLFGKKEFGTPTSAETKPHSELDQVCPHKIHTYKKAADHNIDCTRVLDAMSFGKKYLSGKNKKSKKPVDSQRNDVPRKQSLSSSRSSILSSGTNSNNDYTWIRGLKITNEKDLMKVVIPKSSSGFGFTVKGSGPVSVSRVKEDSTALVAGLKRGDVIWAINGQNVSEKTATSVARIVRHSPAQIVLDIYRSSHEEHSTHSINQNSSPAKRPLPLIPDQSTASGDSICGQSLSMDKGYVTDRSWCKTDSKKNLSTNMTKWDPDISRISAADDQLNFEETFQTVSENHIYEEIDEVSSEWPDSDSETSSIWKRLTNVSCDLSEHELSKTLKNVSMTTAHEYSYYSDESLNSAFTQESSLEGSQLSLSCEELDCLGQIMAIEADFVHQMRRGVYSLARPLRNRILSALKYQCIFQNVEKLIVLSERIVHAMADSDRDLSLATLYGEQIHLMCDAYLTYMTGLPEALRMCKKLRENPDILEFLRSSKCHMSVEDFLERPVKHFLDLLAITKRLAESQACHKLDSIVESFIRILQLSIEREKRSSTTSLDSGIACSPPAEGLTISDSPVYENASVAKRTATCQPKTSCHHTSFGNNTTSEYIPMNATPSRTVCAREVDAQIYSIQRKMQFPKDMKPFYLAAPGRHLVYSGDLSYCTRSGETREVMTWLCSDLLLLTTATPLGLKPVCYPLYLDNITSSDFSSLSCEFDLSMAQSVKGGNTPDVISLKAHSYEDKCVWKNIIQHQIRLASSYNETIF